MPKWNLQTPRRQQPFWWTVAVLALVSAVTAGAVACCRRSEAPIPVGTYEISEQREHAAAKTPKEIPETITFTGFGRCTVSAGQPDVELHNLKGN